MADLSEFGAGLENVETNESRSNEKEEEEEEAPSSTGKSCSQRRSYPNGRCRGISTGERRRCRSPQLKASGTGLCNHHHFRHQSITIDDDPIKLIQYTSGTQFEDLADRDGLDFLQIQEALHAAIGLENHPIRVREDGVVLPRKYATADRIIMRAPTKTVDSRIRGTDTYVHSAIRAADYDSAYLDGDGRTVRIRNEACLEGALAPKIGLKIPTEPQEWYPVEIVGVGADQQQQPQKRREERDL